MKITEYEINGNRAVKLNNDLGMTVTLCALGAGLVSVSVPDRDGVARELTKLSEKGYGCGHNGLTTGRTAGRIANAAFTIDGRTAALEKNNFGVDNLHGGSDALHNKVYGMQINKICDGVDVVFTYRSPDGEGGYFGNIDVTVTYTVYDKKNGFDITFEGKSDVKTLLNLTNHVYWNASGDLREPTTKQVMYINASRVGKLDERLIAREIIPVPEQFDFRTAHPVGDHVNDELVQRYTHGYDHPFFLDENGLGHTACFLYSETSGIKISVSTTYPCVVVYGDNYGGYNAMCFECQYHPDGIHACPENCGILSPDKPYRNVMRYDFTIE